MPLEGKSEVLGRPIRIAHLITELNVGGAERMLCRLAGRMNPDLFRPVIISMTDRGPMGEKIASEGVRVFSLGMSPGRPNAEGSARLYRLLKEIGPEILQTWLYHADLLGLIVGKIARVKRIAWGLRCSNVDTGYFSPLTNLTVRACSRLSPYVDAIVVNSERGRKVHQERGYSPARMVLIPNGFETDRFQPDPHGRAQVIAELGIPENAVLIGLVARFDPMKDHQTFFRAAAALAAKEAPVHFILAGDGMVPSNADVLALIPPGVRGQVHLLGCRDDIPRLLPALDIATSSSAYGEGFSNTIGEAMACGVPCVATDVGDAAEIIGDKGIVVPPRSPYLLAEAWRRLVDMGSEQRRRLGEGARQRVAENYEIGCVVRRFEEFYLGLHRGER